MGARARSPGGGWAGVVGQSAGEPWWRRADRLGRAPEELPAGHERFDVVLCGGVWCDDERIKSPKVLDLDRRREMGQTKAEVAEGRDLSQGDRKLAWGHISGPRASRSARSSGDPRSRFSLRRLRRPITQTNRPSTDMLVWSSSNAVRSGSTGST